MAVVPEGVEQEVMDRGEGAAEGGVRGRVIEGGGVGLSEAVEEFESAVVKVADELGFREVARAVGGGVGVGAVGFADVWGDLGGVTLEGVGGDDVEDGEVAEHPGGVVHPGRGLAGELVVGQVGDEEEDLEAAAVEGADEGVVHEEG